MHIAENVDLRPFNSFGLHATARYFTKISSVDELSNLDLMQDIPVLVLGGGSNILFTQDVNGYVLQNGILGIGVVREDSRHVYLRAGAGENWHGFVEHGISRGYAGVENLALIPGLTGASPMQNIGAYGMEISEVFHELEAWHLKDREMHRFSWDDCRFGYRESVFKQALKGDYLITHVTFRLNKEPEFRIAYGAIREELERMGVQDLSIRAIADAVIRIRKSKLPDPAVVGNAGSFFKNPEVQAETYASLQADHPGIVGYPRPSGRVRLAAGWLIERAGWKGFRRGDAGVHAKQALVLVNYGNASGGDILNLSTEIMDSIRGMFGVELEREVNVV